ncbi:MAG: cysteine desulfurase family protein, partial [Candidatus Polarisedimenticolia bacterium]
MTYMDYQATTPVDPRVLETMLPMFSREFGNPASRSHAFGWRAEEVVLKSRQQIARLLRADPKEILFSSGATESNNLAILGSVTPLRGRGDHVITGATEHPSVLDPFRELERRGLRVTVLPVDRHGRIDPDDVGKAIGERTILVSLMAANNEVGTLHPIAAIGRICKARGVLFHTDAAQAAGSMPLDVETMGIDLLSLSAHKMYGPKGIGALYVRRKNPRVVLEPLLYGGGQERGLRSGTLNVPGIVGLGAACALAAAEMEGEARRLAALRDRLQSGILAAVGDVQLNGHPIERLPHNLNLSFAHVEGEALMMALDEVAVSSGSACSSASKEPSPVLRAMGRDATQAQTSLRFSLGRFTTAAEVERVIEQVAGAVRRLRAISPLAAAARAAA